MTSKFLKNALSPNELLALLVEKPDTLLIDLLSTEHFASCHLPGAINACVFQVSFLEELAAVASDKRLQLVVYGSSSKSHDAATALDKLERAGYEQVSFLFGGLEAWRAEGYLLEGEATDRADDPQTVIRLSDGHYAIDHQASRIEWAGRNGNSRHIGTVDVSKGFLDIREKSISGEVEIDMNTIHNINLQGDELQPVLEAHLRSDDFFFTQMFPKAVLTLKDSNLIEPGWITGPNYHLCGVLELRGVSADLEFDATVTIGQDGSPSLEAHFDIDKTRWNIIYGSTRFFEYLGMHQVFDMISLQLRLCCRSVISL